MWHSTHSHYRSDNDYDRYGSGHERHSSYDRDRYDDNGHHNHHRGDGDWRGHEGSDCHGSEYGHHYYGHEHHDPIVILH